MNTMQNKNEIREVDWIPLTQVKYKNESTAKQQAVRMGLLLNKTLTAKKNEDNSYSVYQINEIKLRKINQTLEGV